MRPSKIDKLPPEIRDQIAALRAAGKTIDEIMAALKALELPPGSLPVRSGLAAHVQGLDRLAEKVQRGRAVAEALVRKLGDAPESRQARLNIELTHSLITDLMLAQGEGDAGGQSVTLDPGQVHFLAKSLDHLARAQRSDLHATLELRKEISEEQNKRVDKATADIGHAAREAGLSAERIADLQARVAGLRITPEKSA